MTKSTDPTSNALATIKANVPPGEAHLTFGMSALLLLGGGIGYAKARSVPSLAAGAAFAVGYGTAGYLISKGQAKEGHGIAYGLSATLAGVMGLRAYQSQKFMPAGLVAGLGVASGAYELVKVVEWW